MSKVPILLEDDGTPVGPLEDYLELKEFMRWFTGSTFKLKIDVTAERATDIVKGRYIWVQGAEEVYLVEQIHDFTEDGNPDRIIREVQGPIAGMFGERLVLPASGEAYDRQTAPAETLLKHYVDENAGPGAAVNRQVPNLSIETDAAAGASFTISGRYNVLSTLLSQIGVLSGFGWTTEYNPSTQAFVFVTKQGTDRSTSVVFSNAFANIERQGLIQTEVGRKTFAYVGGQGEGVARSIVEKYIEASEPTGLSRREMFVDARDIDVEEEAAGALDDRGEEKLEAAQPEDALELEVDPNTNFRFGVDYFLGDIIGVRDDRLSYVKSLRVVEAIRTSDELRETVKLALARPYPSLHDQTRAQAASAGSRAGDGAVIDYPTGFVPGDIKTSAVSVQDGWLLCDGSAVSRSTYAKLFNAISTTFGAGDGSTTFNIPDFRDRFIVGVGITLALGDTGGQTAVPLHSHSAGTLSAPAHTHSTPNHTHTVSLAFDTHSHASNNATSTNSVNHTHDITADAEKAGRPSSPAATEGRSTQTDAHTHTVNQTSSGGGTTGGASSTTISGSTANAGSGSGDNRPPYLAMYLLIKT